MNAKTGLHYFGSVLLGAAVMFALHVQLSSLHPIFWQLGPSGLVVPVFSGLTGGAVAALLAPRSKLMAGVWAGMLLAAVLMSFLLRNGLNHLDRNPLFWYWPIWLIPASAVGGYLLRKPLCNRESVFQRSRFG